MSDLSFMALPSSMSKLALTVEELAFGHNNTFLTLGLVFDNLKTKKPEAVRDTIFK